MLVPSPPATSRASSTQRKDSSGSGGGQQRGETAYEKLAQFDVAGSVVFAIFLGFLLLGVNRGNAQGWTSTPILTYFAVAAG